MINSDVVPFDYVPKRPKVALSFQESSWLHEQLVEATLQGPPPPPILPRVQNMVASFHCGCRLDILKLSFTLRNSEYDPRKLNCLMVRLPDPRVAANVFRSGRVKLVGARCPEDAVIAAVRFTRVLQLAGVVDAKTTHFKIDSATFSADLRFPVRLETLVKEHGSQCQYDPEVSASVVFRHPKATFLVFVTGKLIMSGCTDMEALKAAFAEMYGVFLKHRR